MGERSRPARRELGRIERQVAIRSFAEFRDLPGPEIALLASIARSRAVSAGERLLEPGRPVGTIFLVVEGELAVRRGDAETRVGRHELAGASFALADDPQGCECVAVQDGMVLEIAADDLEDVFEDHRAVLAGAVSRLAREALSLRTRREDDGSSAQPVPGPSAPLDLVQRILILRRMRGLAGASIDGIAALAGAAREVRAPSGHVLWRAGDPSGTILALVGGSVRATWPDGRSATIVPFELVGNLDSLAGEARAHDVVVGEPVVALAIERDAMLDAWEDHLDLGTEMLRHLSRSVLALGAPRDPG